MKKLILLIILVPTVIFANVSLAYYQPFKGMGFPGIELEFAYPIFKYTLFVDIGASYYGIDSLRISGSDFIQSSFGEANMVFLSGGLGLGFFLDSAEDNILLFTCMYGCALLVKPGINETRLENDLQSYYDWDLCQANVETDFGIPHGLIASIGYYSWQDFAGLSIIMSLIWMKGSVDFTGNVRYGSESSTVNTIPFPDGDYKLSLRGFTISIGISGI